MTPTKRETYWWELGKFIVAAIVATVCATGSAVWAARGVIAEFDKRMTTVETKQAATDAYVIKALDDLRVDMREVRGAVISGDGSRGRP